MGLESSDNEYFARWQYGTSCVPGGRLVSLYMYNVTNADAVASSKAKPHVEEVGPWIYGIGWEHRDLLWSGDSSRLTYTAYEYIRFCTPAELYILGVVGRPSDQADRGGAKTAAVRLSD